MLQELKRTGARKIITEQINSGKLYIGASAGIIVLSHNIEYVEMMDDCNKTTGLEDYTALSVVDFYPLPHYTNFPFKKAVENIISEYEAKLKLVPIINDQAIIVNNNAFVVLE